MLPKIDKQLNFPTFDQLWLLMFQSNSVILLFYKLHYIEKALVNLKLKFQIFILVTWFYKNYESLKKSWIFPHSSNFDCTYLNQI